MILKHSNTIESARATIILVNDDNTFSTQHTLPDAVEKHWNLLEKFTGKAGDYAEVPVIDETLSYYIYVGVGQPSVAAYQTAVGKAIKGAAKLKAESLTCLIDQLDESLAKVVSEALITASYQFDDYKSDKKPSPVEVCTVVTEYEAAVKEGNTLGEATLIARKLVNAPANVLNPVALADYAVSYGKTYGFNVEVLDEKVIQELNMKAYWEVAKSSANKPRFIIMTYQGNPDSDEILGLVGKGLTFDTGGYSIKSKDGMLTMKSDMGGSAAVIGAMAAIAKQGLKLNVTAVVAACENMISSAAYRPGDIIESRGGKTIYIKSTDAEGRLTLIDAVDYIIKDLKASRVIDVATLTGACVVALGNSTTGVVSNDNAFFKVLEEASEETGERVWRMPMFPEYKEILKHKEADLVNATRLAGMITAGMFIGEFVGDTPWIHMDIAGTSWRESGSAYYSNGGTGVGVKNLYQVAKSLQ